MGGQVNFIWLVFIPFNPLLTISLDEIDALRRLSYTEIGKKAWLFAKLQPAMQS